MKTLSRVFRPSSILRFFFGNTDNQVLNVFRGNSRDIRGSGNKLAFNGAMKNVKVEIIGNNNEVSIDASAFVGNTLIYIYGSNNVLTIGKGVRFKSGELWIENENCTLQIGEKTTVVNAHLAVTETGRKLIIGKDCMLSREIEFRTGDSHSIIDLATGKKINEGKDIVVGDHVWIGARVILLKGVSIGDHSIVGTGSIVTESIGPNAVAAGVPARVVRTNVSWDRKRMLENDKRHE